MRPRRGVSMSPYELDHLFIEILAKRYDIFKTVGPHNNDMFVSLSLCTKSRCEWVVSRRKLRLNVLTMKAAHCSFSARGNSLMVSSTCILVSESMYMELSLGILYPKRHIIRSARNSGKKERSYIVAKAAWTAALRILTATTGFSSLTAASNGTNRALSYGKTLNWPVSVRMQTPVAMRSSAGLNHASPCVCSRKREQDK